MRYVIQQKLLKLDLQYLKCKFLCKIHNSRISQDNILILVMKICKSFMNDNINVWN